jgi:hypothetical protein
MTFQLRTDKNPFHTIYIGMNPLRKDAATRTKEDIDRRFLHISISFEVS